MTLDRELMESLIGSNQPCRHKTISNPLHKLRFKSTAVSTDPEITDVHWKLMFYKSAIIGGGTSDLGRKVEPRK